VIIGWTQRDDLVIITDGRRACGIHELGGELEQLDRRNFTFPARSAARVPAHSPGTFLNFGLFIGGVGRFPMLILRSSNSEPRMSGSGSKQESAPIGLMSASTDYGHAVGMSLCERSARNRTRAPQQNRVDV